MKSTLIFLLAMVSSNAFAESSAVYEKSFDQNLETAYPRVYKALDAMVSRSCMRSICRIT